MNVIKISVEVRDSARKFAVKRTQALIDSGKGAQLIELLEEAYIRGADEALTRYVSRGKLPGEAIQ